MSKRFYSSEPSPSPEVSSKNDAITNKNDRTNLEQLKASIPENNRFVYPDFLPDPNMKYRHPIREKIERQDMLNRRYVMSKNVIHAQISFEII